MAVIKGVVVSKQLVADPVGTRYVKIDVVEEKDVPGPLVMSPPDEQSAQMAREIMPLVSQIVKSLPFSLNKIAVPRLTLWLTDDEAERRYRCGGRRRDRRSRRVGPRLDQPTS